MVDAEYDGNPFLSLDWHLLWLRHFGGGDGCVRYVVVRSEGEGDLGYFPCVLRAHRVAAGVSVRALGYAGNLYSPVTGPVVRRDVQREVFGHFVGTVMPSLRWTVARLIRLQAECSTTTSLEESLGQAGVPYTNKADEANWVWDGPGVDARAYFAQLQYNIRRNVKGCAKKLEPHGPVRFEMVTGQVEERHVRDYRAVSGRSWKEPEADPAFHPALMRVAARRGWLRLGFLYVGERPIASQLWLMSRGRGYIVKLAYDEEFRAASAGTLLTWRMVEHCMDHDGMRYFDYLRGDDEYKRLWCNVRRERRSVMAFRPGVTGRALHLLKERVLPLVRRGGAGG
jgi:hypothetical protein